MNFLRLKSEALARFRQRHGRYWLDRLVEQVYEHKPGTIGVVWAVLENPCLDYSLAVPGLNIVTTAGDTYYAQKICGESPTKDFAGANSGLRLGSATPTVDKSDTDVQTYLSTSAHALDNGYPKSNDNDTDNSGAGVKVVTWRYSYTTSEGNVSNINEGAVVDNRTTPTAALTHFLFAAAFSKTSSDTLKVFVNHTQNGV